VQAGSAEFAAAIAETALPADERLVGQWSVNLATGAGQWSSEVFVIFGVDPSSFVPTYDTEIALVHPYDRPRIEQTIAATLLDGKAFRVYFRVVHADGSVRVIHSRGELRGPAASATIEGTAQDVTERVDGDRAISPRQRHVLDLIAHGLTAAEIAVRLQISPQTVRSHVQNAIDNLDAHNRVHAVVLALRSGDLEL
jgi:DNA-binding CsgD family transcriptional regulator